MTEDQNKPKISEMTPEGAAEILQKMGWQVTAHDIRKDIQEGAPTNEDGTINTVKYASWLLSYLGEDIHD